MGRDIIKVKRIFYTKENIKYVNEVLLDVKTCKHLKEKLPFLIKNQEININNTLGNKKVPCLSFPISEIDSDYDYDDNLVQTYENTSYDININYCPICGEHIIKNISAIKNVTEEILPIIESIDELRLQNKKKFAKKRQEEIYLLTEKYMKIMQIDTKDENYLYI